MAGRTPFVKAHFSQKDLLFIVADVAIGSTGAPTLTASTSPYIKSISRTATGKYTVTLGDGNSPTAEAYLYKRLAFFDGNVLFNNSGAPSGAIAVQVTQDLLSSAGQLTIVCVSATNTPADPESGSTLKLFIVIKPN